MGARLRTPVPVTIGTANGTVYAELDTRTLIWPYLETVEASQAQLLGQQALTAGPRKLARKLSHVAEELGGGVIIHALTKPEGRQRVIEVPGLKPDQLYVGGAAVILLLDLIVIANRTFNDINLAITWHIGSVTSSQARFMREQCLKLTLGCVVEQRITSLAPDERVVRPTPPNARAEATPQLPGEQTGPPSHTRRARRRINHSRRRRGAGDADDADPPVSTQPNASGNHGHDPPWIRRHNGGRGWPRHNSR